MNRSFLRQRSGLTLIELMVAVGLFALLTLAVTRVFLRVADVQEKITQQQNLEGDFRYAMNVFADEIQKAKHYSTVKCGNCGDSTCSDNNYFCSNSGRDRLCILDANDVCVSYYRNQTNGQLMVQRASTIYAITSKDVMVDNLIFEVFNSAGANSVVLRSSLKSVEPNGETLVYQTAITNTAIQ